MRFRIPCLMVFVDKVGLGIGRQIGKRDIAGNRHVEKEP